MLVVSEHRLDDHLHPYLPVYPNFLVPEAAELVVMEEPAAAAAKDQDCYPWMNHWATVVVVVVLEEVLVDRNHLAAAEAAAQDCPEVDDPTLCDRRVPVTLVATNHPQEVDCHCHLVDRYHHCPESRCHCQAARSSADRYPVLHHQSQFLKYHPG